LSYEFKITKIELNAIYTLLAKESKIPTD